MKNYLIFLILIFNAAASKAQWHNASVEFLNGEEVVGIAKIKGNKIKFKKEETAKPQIFTYKEVKSISVSARPSKKLQQKLENQYGSQNFMLASLKYSYLKPSKHENFQLLMELYSGSKISIYQGVAKTVNLSTYHTGKPTFIYFIRKDERVPTRYYRTGFLFAYEVSYKNLIEYFSDCIELKEKLETKAISNGIFDVVKYYENECN